MLAHFVKLIFGGEKKVAGPFCLPLPVLQPFIKQSLFTIVKKSLSHETHHMKRSKQNMRLMSPGGGMV